MTNKKFNLTKGGWLILICFLCFGIILFSVTNSQALPIPMDLTNTSIIAGGPDGGTPYLTLYYLKSDELGISDAFCVEKVAANNDALYELVDVPAGLLGVATLASRYYDGTVLALLGSSYAPTDAKVVTQIAIWDILGIYSYNMGKPLYSEVQVVKGIIPPDNKSASVYLAQSPRSAAGSNSIDSQNYLVSVPDASIMLLLGPAFIALGLLGRKKNRTNNYKHHIQSIIN